jgi:hypothetical protein
LLQIAVIFAASGIPVAILWALYDAWRLLPFVGQGIGYWSLAVGFATGSFALFTAIFGMVGLLFGLMVTLAPPATIGRRPLSTATWIGGLAGLAAGFLAYRFGGYGAGEASGDWWSGALTLAGMCGLTCAGLGALYFRVAQSAGAIGAGSDRRAIPEN